MEHPHVTSDFRCHSLAFKLSGSSTSAIPETFGACNVFRKLQSVVIVKDTWLGFGIVKLNLSHFFYQLSAATRMVRELMVDKYIVIGFGGSRLWSEHWPVVEMMEFFHPWTYGASRQLELNCFALTTFMKTSQQPVQNLSDSPCC